MPKTVESLVNRVLLKWEKRRQMHGAHALPQEPRQQPIVTISGDAGDATQLVARRVGEQLDFDVIDSQLVELIASSAQVHQRVVRSLDEHVADAITEYIIGAFDSGGMTQSEYLAHLSRIVLTVGQHGNAVIVGHGAQYILDPKWTLRTRLVTPLETRVQRTAESEHISEKRARALVLASIADQAAFCRKHFDRDVADPHYYDLVLNCEVLPQQACAELIAHAFRVRFGDGDKPDER